MRKVFIFCFIICLVLSGCNNKKDVTTVNTNNTTSVKKEITSSDIREKVPYALKELLESAYVPRDVDIWKTEYTIGTVEWDDKEDAWIAYGEYTMYKKTGSIYETGSFELNFSKEGRHRSYYSRRYDTYEY